MKLFEPQNRAQSRRHRRIYAAWEILYTIVDFSAAMLFLVGSVMFFYKSWETPAIWCFVVGSAFFAMKPTIRLARELHYLAIGDVDDIASELRQ